MSYNMIKENHMDKAESYEKFKVAVVKKTYERPTTVPISGIGMLMSYVQEKIEEGNIVTIIPYTREEWSKFICD